MRIALDAMGGDGGIPVNVQGAVEALSELELDIVLVGDEARLKEELLKYEVTRMEVEPASQVVEMDESPSSALRRKKDSSLSRAVAFVQEGRADAMVSAGNTGAAMAMGKVTLGTLKGVERPAIATPMPTPAGISILLDSGANVDCKPKHLLQFAIMGETYVRYVLGRRRPRVGLLSIGSEEMKGNELTKETHRLLRQTSLNFIGNVEGRSIFSGEVDVIVCDGFVGNIVLKSSEGIAEFLESSLRQELSGRLRNKLGSLLIRMAYRKFQKRIDYAERGGAPFLGIDGVCIICHGNSSPKAIKNGIRVARELVENRVNEHIREAIGSS